MKARIKKPVKKPSHPFTKKPFKSIPKYMEVYCDTLAGVKFADSQRTTITAGDPVELVWERSNPYDPNAIRVDLNNVKLGYIKAKHTHTLHACREAGIKLNAFIRGYYPDEPTYNQIVVVVYGEKPNEKPEVTL